MSEVTPPVDPDEPELYEVRELTDEEKKILEESVDRHPSNLPEEKESEDTRD